MTKEELHAAAARRFGVGKGARDYIKALAELLEVSESGVAKWWYGQASVPGPVAAYFRDVGE